MVVEDASGPVDRAFQALSDPTRRDIVRRTLGTPLSVSRLAESYPMSFAAVQKHVAVLEAAGLVTKTRRGREQLVSASTACLDLLRSELDALESLWRERITRMGSLLIDDTKEHEG